MQTKIAFQQLVALMESFGRDSVVLSTLTKDQRLTWNVYSIVKYQLEQFTFSAKVQCIMDSISQGYY